MSIQRYYRSLIGLAVVSAVAAPCWGQTSYSTGFEAPTYTASDAQNADGVLAGQDGWTGGAQAGFTNDDYDIDNDDGTYGDEKVTTADAHGGTQSWRYSRGYGSPGQGTPFSPPLSGTVGAPGAGADYDTMTATLWFKPVNPAGDGSTVSIYQGTPAGNDRTGFNVYLESTASGVDVGTYRWTTTYVWEDIVTGLALDEWHSLDIDALFTDDYANDVITYTVDKGMAGEVSSTGNSWPHPWREANGFVYAPGNSLKFAAGQDGEAAYKGFYFDDITYEAWNSTSAGIIPEPASLIVWSLLAAAGVRLGCRRRKGGPR